MKWLPDIWNYMKKLKPSSVSMVSPTRGMAAATQKAKVGGSIVGFVLSRGYFLL